MEKIIKTISSMGIIPVVKMDDAADAIPLAEALKRGGLPCAEITFRTEAAEEAICRIKEKFPDFFIGAGTILTKAQADAAMNAGASFLVSPGLNPEIVKYCREKEYPIIPGVCTPSEVEAALSLGLTYLKFFPAEAAGGVKMIQAMSAPYKDVKFMPTGGINPENVKEYLTCQAVYACGGSWMVPTDKISNKKFEEIEMLAKETSKLMNDIRNTAIFI
ncbi:MAG: bifunctional 4-hydroxy-2-oxoglutarate aldolase/2-dehydro-3-deoxy-phosphogluconate aldolase [Clostridia bacterium]|nr:bifunctional 4-hydroxy-2-oxoglutarate aldolase/2-dehydro-3-deoxy-phosphogluconate aldolase [Clostridia bacterium]